MSTSPSQSLAERGLRQNASPQPSSPTSAHGSMPPRSPPPQYAVVSLAGMRHGVSSTQPASILIPLSSPPLPRARMTSQPEPMLPPLDAQVAEVREGNSSPSPILADSQVTPLTHRQRHRLSRQLSQRVHSPEDHKSGLPSPNQPFAIVTEPQSQQQPQFTPAQADLHASPKQSASLRSGKTLTTSSPPEQKIPGYEEEDRPPSPASIASTAMSPSLLQRREELERELEEMMQNTKQNGSSTHSHKSSIHSHKSSSKSHPPPPSLPAYSSPKFSSDSRSTLTANKHSFHHPSQSLAVPPSSEFRAATPLSYASQTPYMGEPVVDLADPGVPRSQSPPPTRQYHATPTNTAHPSSPPNTQAAVPLPSGGGSRRSSPPLSSHGGGGGDSHLGSPQRSIPGHPSPNHSAIADNSTTRFINGSNFDTGGPDIIDIYPPPSPQKKTLRRRDHESIQYPPPPNTKKRSSDLTPVRLGAGMMIMLSRASSDGPGYYSASSISSGVSQPAQAVLIPGTTHSSSSASLRTLDSVRSQVAGEIAYRTISKSNLVDGVRTGIADASSASGPDDISFIHLISSSLTSSFTLKDTPYLFLITTTATPTIPGILFITSSSRDITSRAVQLCSAKFVGRLSEGFLSSSSPSYPRTNQEGALVAKRIINTSETEHLGKIKNLNISSFDLDILQFILRSASRTPLDPKHPPPGSKSINTLLAEIRSAHLQRITPRQAITELRDNLMDVPVVLVDIRPQAQRDEFGCVRGALVVERNVLEWRFDPRGEARLAIADRYDLRVIVFCQEGYTSSLAAYALHQLGLLNATDIIGGYKAWKEAGLPVEIKPERSIASLAGSIV